MQSALTFFFDLDDNEKKSIFVRKKKLLLTVHQFSVSKPDKNFGNKETSVISLEMKV